MTAEVLAELATKHQSDKWNGHWYAGPYANHLSKFRETNLTMLEIGVGGYDDPKAGGASLRMWEEYFPRGKIVGLDYYDKSYHNSDRIKIYQGSQADPVTIGRIVMDHPEGFDVIVDDGSHRNEHVIGSLYMLWQYVKDGGFYIIEDLQTAYWPNHGGRLYERNSPQTSMGFLKSLVDCLNWEEIHQPNYQPSSFDLNLKSIHFYHNMAFLEKGSNREGSTELRGNRLPNF